MSTSVKKIRTKNVGGMFRRAMVICVAVACLTAACKKDDKESPLVGTWTSVSATGTVTYSSSAALTNAVNSKMATYDLTNMAVLEFDAKGKAKYLDMGLPSQYSYSLKDDLLYMTPDFGGGKDLYTVKFVEDGFTLTHGGIFIGDILAQVAGNLGVREREASGLSGSISISAVNMTIKFQKVKK